jgi:hypothetical protein
MTRSECADPAKVRIAFNSAQRRLIDPAMRRALYWDATRIMREPAISARTIARQGGRTAIRRADFRMVTTPSICSQTSYRWDRYSSE